MLLIPTSGKRNDRGKVQGYRLEYYYRAQDRFQDFSVLHSYASMQFRNFYGPAFIECVSRRVRNPIEAASANDFHSIRNYFIVSAKNRYSKSFQRTIRQYGSNWKF